MNLQFTICPLASVVMILVILINIYDIYLIGTNLAVFIINAFISVVIVWIANKTCDKWQWVSWILVGYLAFSAIGYLAIILDPRVANDPKIKNIIERDRAEIKKGVTL